MPLPSRWIDSGIALGVSLALLAGASRAGTLQGTIRIPARAGASISPAIIDLDPVGRGRKRFAERSGSGVVEVDQVSQMFVPRVATVALGGTIRFHNSDPFLHDIHSGSRDLPFNIAIAAGQTRDYRPSHPGLIRLLCDIHQQMRGYVLVTPTAWAAVVGPGGEYRIAGVPDGRYRVHVWQEFCVPQRATVEVHGGSRKDLELRLDPTYENSRPAPERDVRGPWPVVLGQIDRKLAQAIEAAHGPSGAETARHLAEEEAYFQIFESTSRMEQAVGQYLGGGRKFDIECRFREVWDGLEDQANGRLAIDQSRARVGRLTAALDQAADDLRDQGVAGTDQVGQAAGVVGPVGPVDSRWLARALRDDFADVLAQLQGGDRSAAAKRMTAAYLDHFEPLELPLQARNPDLAARLESRFRELRGQLANDAAPPAGAEAALEDLRADVERAIAANLASPATAWMTLVNSSVIIVREGMEALLIVVLLITCVQKAGQGQQLRTIYGAVGAAVIASLVTAYGIHTWLGHSAGRMREALEGGVMLLAAGVLFYVSYWLISQSESKRWQEFLVRRLRQSAASGRSWALALTAFVAVYREGAETVLLYQALAGTAPGQGLPILAGFGLGLTLLIGVFWLVRRTGYRLPLRPFFRVTSGMLFGLAVIFAGGGVAELQGSGWLKLTPVAGVPRFDPLGLHPSIQSLAVQGLLIAGAAAALAVIWWENSRSALRLDPAVPAGASTHETTRG